MVGRDHLIGGEPGIMNEAKGMINGSWDPSDQRRVRGREMKEGTERYGSCKRGLPGRPNGKEGLLVRKE